MRIIKIILDKPYLVLLITTLIVVLIPIKYFLYSLMAICLIFTISLIYTIFQKKWLRLTLSILTYLCFFIVWFFYGFFKDISNEIKPISEVGNVHFYKNEIKKSSDIIIPKGLKIMSKLDTIIYKGIENEYDAECLYKGPENEILEIEQTLINNKDFIKTHQLEKYPTSVLNQHNFNLRELKSVYVKELEGIKIFIAFNKENTKFYYSAFYY
jgi:energy-coupling factor transporter transmembrane protein EcfT